MKRQQPQQQQPTTNKIITTIQQHKQQQQHGSIPKMEAKFLASALSFLSIFLAVHAQSFGK